MIITDAAFPYLVAQRGFLYNLRNNRNEWQEAYVQSLKDDLRTIRFDDAKLPDTLLDVGGGMSGISVLLHDLEPNLRVDILDGIEDPPILESHHQTFSHREVARDFLRANGVDMLPGYWVLEGKYDLVLSLQAWCFHFPPATYLKFVKDHCHVDTTLVIDVRIDKPEWMKQLTDNFRFVKLLRSAIKYQRMAFRAY